MYTPSWEIFKKKAAVGNLIPVYRKVLADLETPVSAFLKIDDGNYSFLLESVEGGDRIAQYSFLGSNPSVIFQAKGKEVTITENGVSRTLESDNPLGCLEDLMQMYKPVEVDGVPRFFGGAVGYVGYDAVRFFEKLPDDTDDDLELPDIFFVITDKILIFDRVNHEIMVVCNAHVEGDAEAAYREATREIDTMVDSLQRPLAYPTYRAPKSPRKPVLVSNFEREEFEETVRAAKEYIRAGDIFQVVVSQRFATKVEAPPFDIYRALRSINPSPYMF
ncbi:MAG: chorismate-binding protein, partial [Candidatus Abyssubacteria bacterium]|nr:chorismate-binding protein [Candidatus Abyssubacteria bacterium]